MKIISWNVNGLRSVYKKGFLEWFKKTGADIVCLQEIKLGETQLSPDLLKINRYSSYFNFAKKKGYSGVGVYSQIKPLKVKNLLGIERFDQEGRLLKLEYPDFTLLNLYFPHGGRQKENMGYKLEVYDCFLNYLKKIKGKNVIILGDFNVAHQEIDLARPKDNKNNTMFTPEERKRIDEVVNLGFVDTFRQFHQEGGCYTWWPYYRQARERNLGWRLDYIFVSKSLAIKVKDSFILSGVQGSDHCPIGIEI